MEDPAPDEHPGGFDLTYGANGFDVVGLAEGASTTVALFAIDGEGPVEGDGYWKYGPETPISLSAWFRFDPDEATGTGAVLDTIDVTGLGFRRAWILSLTDGVRGDRDGEADGVIRDPGGPGTGGPDRVGPDPVVPPVDGPDPVDPVVPPTAPVDPAAPTSVPNAPATEPADPRPGRRWPAPAPMGRGGLRSASGAS